jgi:prepilin-type N-terminal cleavage/methylation domain-containing protein
MDLDVKTSASRRFGRGPRATRKAAFSKSGLRSGNARRGFTLVELLVVLAIIGLVAGLLLPGLAGVQARSKQVACVNNLKQMALSAQMYSADNNGKLAENFPEGRGTNSWVLGNMKLAANATNAALIRQGKLFPYASQPSIYQCPADSSTTGGVPRVRSYSMNSWMGSRSMELEEKAAGYRSFVRDSELATAGASRLWLLADELESSIDDGWFLVTMDDSRPFASRPAARHQRGYGLNFADGHAEVFHLRDPNTLFAAGGAGQYSPGNSDWLHLKQVTTLR